MKSNALHSPTALGKKVLRETGSEDMRGAWEGEWLPQTPAKSGGHPRTATVVSRQSEGQAGGGKRTRHLGSMQPWFPAVPGSLPLPRYQTSLTSLKPPSWAGSSRLHRYRCLQKMNLAKWARCRVPGAGRISGHGNDSPYACAYHLSLSN